MTRVLAVIPAAGRGVRFGSGENKVFARLAGRTVLEWTLAALSPICERIVIVGREEEQEALRRLSAGSHDSRLSVTSGGATRQDSVAQGLAILTDCPGTDIVLIHDAARPLVTRAVLDNAIAGAEEFGAAVAALPVSDTLKSATETAMITGTVDRMGLCAMQTPQAFRLELLRAAHAHAAETGFQGTDEASIIEHWGSHPVRLVPAQGRTSRLPSLPI